MRAINREILRLAIPSILANITVPLVGMVDIAVTGHLDANSATLIGGISIGSMLFDLLYWNFGFLRAGTGGLTAQAFGRGDRRAEADTFLRSNLIALGFAILLIAIQWIFVKGAFLVVTCSPEVKELAERYFFIRIWAAPATLSLMACKGWFIGMQDSVSSMATDLVVNIVNIGASIVLALGVPRLGLKGLGFDGVALGTLSAQYTGLLTAYLIVFFKYRRKVFEGYRPEWLRTLFKGDTTRKFFSINADLFIRSLCFIAIYIGYTLISARYGDVLLASASIMMKLMMIFSFFTDGFAYAGEALSGRAVGAKDTTLLRDTVKWTFIWSGAIALMFVFIYFLTEEPMLRMMTKDVSVIDASREFLVWLLLMPVAGVAAFTWDGIYIGVTASKGARNSMIWSVIAFVAVWFGLHYAIRPGSGVAAVHVLMAAYFAHLLARDIYLTLNYRNRVLMPERG